MAELSVPKPEDVQKEIEATIRRIQAMKAGLRLAKNLAEISLCDPGGRGAILDDVPGPGIFAAAMEHQKQRLAHLRAQLRVSEKMAGKA